MVKQETIQVQRSAFMISIQGTISSTKSLGNIPSLTEIGKNKYIKRHQTSKHFQLPSTMSLCRTYHPKAALERTVFEEAANCAVTPPRGEGWTPWSVQSVPIFHCDTLLVPCKLILHDCLVGLRVGTEGSWVCIHSIFDGV